LNGGTASIVNDTDINDVWTEDGVTQNRNRNVALLNNTDNSWKSMAYNVNYKRTFDSTDRELTVDLDYSKFMGQGSDNIRNNYYNSVGEETQVPLLLKSDIPSDVDIKSFKADYVHPLGKKAKFEAGVKSSYVITDNDVKFDLFEENRWIVDTTKTNHFKYTENINAAYCKFQQRTEQDLELTTGFAGRANDIQRKLYYPQQSSRQKLPGVFPQCVSFTESGQETTSWPTLTAAA
jgi:hypothetical protein